MEEDLFSCSDNFKESYKQRSTTRLGGATRDKSKTPRVCVVGAGLAGLRCAEVLIEMGVMVTILEARDRLGGRVGYPPITSEKGLMCGAGSPKPIVV